MASSDGEASNSYCEPISMKVTYLIIALMLSACSQAAFPRQFMIRGTLTEMAGPGKTDPKWEATCFFSGSGFASDKVKCIISSGVEGKNGVFLDLSPQTR